MTTRTILSAATPRPSTEGALASGETSLAAKRRASCLPGASVAMLYMGLFASYNTSPRNSGPHPHRRHRGCQDLLCISSVRLWHVGAQSNETCTHCCRLGPPDPTEGPAADVPPVCVETVALLRGRGGGVGAAEAAALGTDPGPSPTAAGSPLRLRDVKPVARGVGSPSKLLRAGLAQQTNSSADYSRRPAA